MDGPVCLSDVSTAQPEIDFPVQLLPASSFRVEQLTAAYNQTRVDYLVPMPMTAARLAEYIHVYDIDLDRSVVAVADDQILGLAMLGVRSGRAWITRLGVLPIKRRRGVGEALMHALLLAAARLGIDDIALEVIKNNTPAHALFQKLGFCETGELLVLRRPPGLPHPFVAGEARWLERDEALALIDCWARPQAWTNEAESFANAHGILGMQLTLADGSHGWIVFERQRFILTRIVMLADRGDPVAVGRALLSHLHQRFPELDTHAENTSADDSHLPAFWKAGYVESFRRIEMQRQRHPGPLPVFLKELSARSI